MSLRTLLYLGSQALLLLGILQVVAAFIGSVQNWRDWMPIILSPFLIALPANHFLYARRGGQFPRICIVSAVLLFLLAHFQFLAITTNPFTMPLAPASLAVPVFMIGIAVAGAIAGLMSIRKTENP